MKQRSTPQTAKHAHDRASALGYAAATSGQPNPYAPGTQCAILFDLAREKAIEARSSKASPKP